MHRIEHFLRAIPLHNKSLNITPRRCIRNGRNNGQAKPETCSAKTPESKGSNGGSRPPTEAQVVIGGGGIIGASVAYHLAKAGLTDVVVLEQGRLGGGSTWLTAGLMGQLRESSVETRICQHSAKLYQELALQGLQTGWKECGSLMLARTKDRMTQFKRLKSFSV